MATVARFQSPTPRMDGIARARPPYIQDEAAGFRMVADTAPERSLSVLIESEIIPRMMVAHAGDPVRYDSAQATSAIAPAEVEALAPLAIQVEADRLLAYVDAILARGVSIETAMVELLAPTARLLGEYWEADRCDFVDVTMALWRLQEVVQEIAARTPGERSLGAGGHRALFAAMPGDQHSFGTVVIDELFRRRGWATERVGDASTSDLLALVGGDWYDLVGLTVSCDCHIGPLASVITAVRNVSRNPRVCVMVGGRVFAADPELAVQVGADGTARDAELAYRVASGLVRARAEDAVLCS